MSSTQNEWNTKEMRGGCLAITGNISKKTNMCNLGVLTMMVREAQHEKQSSLSCISQDVATLPHVLQCTLVS